VRSVNEEAGPLGLDPIRPHKIDGLLGGNFAAFLGLGS
jgi:hypothetical protein